MRLDPRPLRNAALAAVAFLVLRIGYRGLFGGLGGSRVLLDLPRIRLGGPFATVTLLGPVSIDGIVEAIRGGLPFAALVLAFGVVAAIVDLRRLVGRWADRGPGRAIARAALIALATLPALAAAVRGARRAAALRGERGSPALLVPVVEHTIERALALAASLELRGFGATRQHEGRCERPVVVHEAELRHASDDAHAVLRELGFELGTGTLALVRGPTGSGKSTLLRAVNGLFQHFDGGLQGGLVEVGGLDRAAVPPRECATFVGAVGQSARSGFAGRTVAEELGLALALRRVPAEIVAARVAETAAAVGVAHLLERPLERLSAGEAARVAIGAAVIARPVVLTVDEPLAELDAGARGLLIGMLDRLAHEAGLCVIVAEHRTDGLAQVADVELALEDGIVRVRRPEERPAAVEPHDDPAPAGRGTRPPLHGAPDTRPRLQLHGLRVAHGPRTVLDDVRLELAAGSVLAVTGDNGAGKSSLLDAVARPTAPGTVLVEGADVHPMRPKHRRRRVALVPEDLDVLFTTTTVAAECRRNDRRHPPAGGPGTFARFTGFLGASAERADALAGRHPRDLSAGERLCLAVALQSAGSPAVLLVDEPARGLDAAAQDLVATALSALARGGTAVVVATHETGFAAAVADRGCRIEAGRLGPVESALGSPR